MANRGAPRARALDRVPRHTAAGFRGPREGTVAVGRAACRRLAGEVAAHRRHCRRLEMIDGTRPNKALQPTSLRGAAELQRSAAKQLLILSN